MNLKFSKGLRGLPVLFFLILSFASVQVSAQNCTVNAGVPESICPGQKMVLKGVYTGLFTSTAVWSQVGGPAVTIGTPLISGSDITANVTGFSPGNVYTFRISARCQDGSQVFQDVVFTTLAATKATVGSNITSCPGLISLTGNTPIGGGAETGDWSIISRAYGMHINTSSSPTSTVTLPTDSTASVVFKWTIINTNGCASAAQMTVTNIGANPVVTAGGNQTLSNCYNLTQSTQLGASYGGNGFMGQQGTWSFVSGPGTPTFGDIHNKNTGVSNLVTGTYRLRWTVAGPCANGSAEMTITVPPPTQSITNSGNANLIFCDSRTATVLNATIPGYTNEVGTWSVINGTATVSDLHTPSILVTNLVAPNFTRLRYTITNSITGCTSSGDFNITYSPQVSVTAINGPITVLPSTATAVSIPYSVTGGNQTLWQLVAGPLGATLALSGITAYQNIDESPIDLTGLDKVGTYNFRLARVTNNAGQGGCENAFADLAIVISQPPTAANAGTSGAIACNVFTTTLAGNAPGTGSGYWSQVSGPSVVVFADIYDRATGISNLVNGSYTFRWIITGGYGAIDAQSDVSVSVASAVPTAAAAGPSQLVCNQTPIKLAGNTPALNETGTWTIAPVTGTFVNIHDPNTKITGLADNSSYTLTWTIANLCGSSFSTTTITTSNTAGPKAAVAGSAQCLSSTATVFNLSGNAPSGLETGLWSLVSGPNTPSITSTASNTTTVTGVVNGTYKFEWSLNTPTCTATRDTVIITASVAATAATVTTTPINLCNATGITLAGNTPVIGTGKWTQVGGPGGAVITDPFSPTSTVTGIVAGSYIFRWTISNGSCSSNSADVKYNNSAPPVTPTVDVDQEICGVATTVLTGNVINPGQGLWKVVSGPNTPAFSSFTNPTATISGLVTGIYKLIWTSSNGANCGISESRTLNVTVRANATASVASSGLCNATVAQLTGNNGSSGTWTFVSGSSIPTLDPNSNFTAIASNLINGTYTFKYTIPASGACVVTSSATVSINITASPSAAQAGFDQNLCSATFVTLGADVPAIGTGTWTIISQPGTGAAFVNSHSPTTNISTATAGVYLLQWNVTNGNCGTNQDIVRITTSTPPTTAVAGANQLTACSGNLTLIANTPSVGVGTWTQVTSMTGTIDAENSPVTAVLGTIPGAYTFMWTIANGSCPSSTSTVDITVSSIPPNPATPGPAQSICNVGATATATLAGSSPISGETGVWTIASKPGAASPGFTDATLFNTTVTNLIQGEYQFTWTVSNGSCVSNSTVTITVTDQPTPSNPGADQSICLYTPVLLHATAVSVGVGTWSVTSQPISTPTVVFSDVNSPTTDVNGLTAGDYTFTWVTTNGSACATSMSNTTVHIVQPPTPALAGSFQTVCLGVNPVLTANSPTFGIGTWAVATSAGGSPAFSPSANANNATVTGLVAGNYTFSWTITSGGCTSEDYMQVTVQPAIGNNQIETPQTICSGTTPIGLTGTNVTGGNGTTYNYQWQQSTTSNVAGFANIPGATATTYGPGALTTTTWYRRIVSSGACTPGTFSNTLEVTVQPPLANNVITAPITTTFCQTGDPDVITGLSATGGDGVTYNYQWEQSTTSASAGFTAITGATSQDYDPATLTVSTWFRRRVSSGACAVITSPVVKITINPYAALTSIQTILPVCTGAYSVYSPTASIAGTTFTWTRPAIATINGNAAGSGTGAFAEQMTNTNNVPETVTYLYSLTVTGCTNPIAYTITVNINPTPVVTLPSSQVVCNGTLTTPIVFTGSPVANTTYNWVNNTPSIGLVASGSSSTINAFTATNNTNAPITASITVTPASNTCNGVSQTFTIVVNPTAFAVTVAKSVCSGAPFTVSPTNGSGNIIPVGTTYSWSAPTGAASADGVAGTAAANISGLLSHTGNTALTAVYMVTPATTACGDGPVFSITITVNPVAAITPISITTCAGVIFNMTPTQTTNGVVPAGTVYSWGTPAITGGLIGGAAGTNLTNLRGTLYNTTTSEATATYNIVPRSGTCIGITFIATATVLPRAVIISQMTVTTCSGVAFDFTPTDGFSGNIIPVGTTYSWPAPTGASLSGGITQTGVDHIFGTFTNSSNITRPVVYNIVPLSGLCNGLTYTVTASILPIVNITTPTFNRVICSGTMFSVTPTNVTNGIVPAGTLYRWSAPVTTGTLTGISTSANSSQITGTLNNPGTTAETATFIVTPSTSCGDGASFTVVVTVYPIAVITPMTTTVCGGVAFAISPTFGVDGNFPVGTRYTWLAPPSGVNFTGGGTAALSTAIFGTLSNTSNAVRTATYLVTPITTAGCAGAVFSVTVTINPTAQIFAMTNVICNGSSFTSIPVNITNNIVPAGTTYTWLAPTGTGFTGGMTGAGSSITGTLANSTSNAHTATYIVTPTTPASCTGATFTITVTVNPIAAVTDMTATTCSGVLFNSIPLDVINGTIPAGTLYAWNAPVAPGITGGASQLSAIASVTGLLTNTTIATAVAVYTVTPTSNGCTGAQFTLTVTLEPSAAVTAMATTVCGGSPFTVTPTNITDGRVPPATTYSWLPPTVNGFTGGISATGSADINGTLLNTTNAVRTATYFVTPLTGGCTGAVFTVTVTLNPLAQVTSMSAITCSGTAFNMTPVNVTNGIVPSGITYSWVVSSVTGAMTGATGATAQTVISGTLLNPTSTQQTATYTVTPNTATCGNGASFTVTVSVNPTATVTAQLSATTCGGVAFSVTPTNVTDGNLPFGTKFSWSLPTGANFTGGATGSNALAVTGLLTNTSSTVTTAFYSVNTVSGVCAGAPFTVTITLNPKAIITQMTGTSCSGTFFAVTPTDITNGIVPNGTTYSWSAPTGSNLTGFATGSGQTNINGTLTNGVNVARTATYLVTPSSVTGVCGGNVFSIVITINPRAYITAITNITCSGVTFNVSPTNLTNGVVPVSTTYRWAVPTLTGSLTGEASGSGASFISGTLSNTSNVAQTATYTVIPTNACGDGASFTVTVTVNPAAAVNTINTVTCSAITFTVTPTDPANGTIPTGTTYTWGVPGVTGGITGGTARGTASATIFGLLTNPTNAAQTATYTVTPLSGNCTGAQFSVVVTLNPVATITAMTNTTCNGVLFTSAPQQTVNGTVPSGTTYTWAFVASTGISNGASATGAGITGTLVNTTNIARTATYTVTPLSGSCTGANFTLVVTVTPAATINALTRTVCSGATFTVSPTTANGIVPAGTLYTWASPAGIGFTGGGTGSSLSFISGTLVNTTNAAVTATYIVSTVSAGCNGATFTLVVTVNPTPTVNTVTDQVLCNGLTSTTVNFTGAVATTTYNWTNSLTSIGLAASGSGTINGFAATNPLAVPVTAFIIVTPVSNTCTGSSTSFSITVHPTPTANTITSQVLCNGVSSTAVNFTGFVANTVYTWINTNAAIGIGVFTGTGNISSFTTTNPTAVPIYSVFAVTPFSNTCTGASTTFSIVVNPTPTADQIASQVICNGTMTAAVNFTGFVANTTYTWTNNTTSIGLAASGSGTINAFTGTNVTSSPVTAVITVTPSSNTCAGAPMAFTITVNPSATLTSSLSPTAICSNTTFSYTATSAVSGATFAWSRTTVTGITSGGAATGTGNINQVLVNSNNTQTNIAYVYTLTANGCTNPMTFTVTVPVNAAASINAVTATTCAGVAFTKIPANITDGIVPAGTTYTWTVPVQSGVSGGVLTSTGTGLLTGNLVNTTNAIGTAVYTITPTSGACTGSTFTLTVTVNPKAIVSPLSSTICSGATFTVTPSDITDGIVPVGTTYSWNAPAATGITGGITGSGAASISGTLVNTTNISRTITYMVTPLSNGCAGNTFSVTVTVDPKATISTMTAVTHSGGTFFAGPVNGINGVVPTITDYSWTLPVVTGGITGITSSGASFVTGGALINPTNSVQTATYTVTPTSGNCVGSTFTVIVTVYPVASINALTVTTCSGVAFSITPTHPTNGNIPAGTIYRWSTPSGTGLTGGAGASSQTTIGGTLVNTTTAPVTATYIVTPTSGGYDGKTFTVTVTVNPTPLVSSTLTPADVCSGSIFAYPVTSATIGSVFTWSRTTVSGITSGGAATGTGSISQTLANGTTSPLSISYAYAITANGCTNPSAGTVIVIVNPIPVLNSTLTPADIYNATVFNYTATSLTPGTTFAWSRAAVTSINSNTTGSGVGATISETLTTTMPSLTAVVYAITLTANGCTNAQTITVNVSPTPALSSSQTPAAICNGTLFAYTATSATPSTTFTWTRAAIATINANATGSGTSGTINEILTNNSNVPVSVVYSVVLTANSFTNTQTVTVVVYPTPSVNQPGAQIVCNNSLTTGVTFSGSVAGAIYNWSNNNTAIGLASAGSGTINAFTATNSTASVVTAIITVIPVSNTCAGPATTFTITVNPTPLLSSTLAPTAICTGSSFTYVATSATTGTSFSWSRTTVTGITSGGPATGTGNVTGQSHVNNTTAPISVRYVYSLTANSCANIQTVTLAVNPTPVLSSTLSPTAVFGGTPFVYTPTSVTTSTTFTWSRAAIAGISNAASSGTGTINEALINTTPSPISVIYSYTSTAAGCTTSQTVTVSIIPSNIDAVTDDFRAICIDGGKGGKTTTVLANDILNSTVVDPALVNMSIVSDGGITGLTINALGELVVPAKTFEGTYTITYNICVTANPGNCDQASATITVCRGLFITTTAVCRNDVPYVHYKVETNFTPATSSPVTLKWLNGDKTVLSAQPIVNGTALEADVLWPGAVVDSAGNPTDWPGWFISNGLWVAGADGFEGTRPNAYLVVSVNPTDTVLLSYPPATPACAVNPVNRPPVAVDDRDSTGQCSALILNVLNNDSDFEHGTLTVSLPSATSLHNGTAVVNTNGTVKYTPPTDFVGEDKFTYTITDAAGLTSSATVTITIASKPQIVGGISGVCALSKDSSAIYSVSPVANATAYLWTLPSGWTGSSTTNSITAKAGTVNGTITVVPYNAGCAGTAVTYNVAIIDYAKVTLTASPSIVKGDGIATSQITIQLFDPNGNPIHCSGGTASLCTSSGVFSDVIDNGDGTYTGYLRSSANAAIICGTVAGKRIEQNVTTTFTGPQGSIKGNGPIFETETPLLTFNFTAGIGPFTVIYKPQGATKTDTLTNVVSNIPIPVKSISATKLYTMVSIIGSDNARRDNNFTRDTATILVVEPKIVITLTADNPKFLADNRYATILRMKVKNIGNIDLASVQVKANLLDVFPNPVQFVLDSVKQAGVKTVPNGRYDGRTNLDLFSWNFNSTPGLRNNMNDIAAAQVPAMAYGNSNNGSTGLNTDGAAGDRTQIPFLPGYHNNAEKENTTATGNNDGPMTTAFFFGALSKLDAGEESDMQLYVTIIPNGYFKPFVMQAVAVGTGHTEFGTALANSLSNDDGNESLHPENTHNGDPLPTVINVFPNPVLGVAMNASTPVLQGNGTYNVTLNYLLKNYGNVNLRQVKLFEELTRSIGSPATFSVISAPVTTGNLIANPSYNGVSDTTMLAANSSLGVGTDATVTFTINITPNQLSALYRLFAIGTGFNTELGNTITDISSNGTNPDPDGNEIPDERLITLIPINMSIPPLVPGTIGIQDTPSTTVLIKAFCGTAVVTVVPNVAPTGGVDAYTYQWQSSADNVIFTSIAGATGNTYTATIPASIYLRRIVISGNQEAFSNPVRVVFNSIAKPVITASGSLNLTQSGSITLTSSAAAAFLWSTNATTNTIAVTTAGAYSVTVTDANGCKATSDLVAINPPPPTTVNRTYVIGGIGNPPNSGIQVTGLTGATLKYYLLSTGGTLIPVPVLPGIIGTYPYYVSQVVNGYESVLVPYTVTMIAPAQLADIQKITSKAPELQADGSYIVNFTIRATNLMAQQLDSVKIKDDLRAVFPTAVQFEVVGVKTSGKLIANELYNGNSQIELLSDGSVLPANQKDSVILTVKVTPNGFSGQLKNTAIQVARSPYGVFSVTSNDPTLSNGITSRAPTEFIIPATDIFIPSGFSPNRDGVNDVFVITRPFNTTINMEIYNRWGNLVYRSRDYNNDWGGKGNQPNNVLGEDLPDGTYYYVVLATDKATGTVRKFAAFITLKR